MSKCLLCAEILTVGDIGGAWYLIKEEADWSKARAFPIVGARIWNGLPVSSSIYNI